MDLKTAILRFIFGDGQRATNISQNPTMNNGNPAWSTDGRWTFSTFFSSQQLVYVRDSKNADLLTVKGQQPAWNASGYLTFCTSGSPYWVLSMWDGQRIVKITQAYEIWAQWQGGSASICYSG